MHIKSGRLILSILFIVCLSFQASAWNPLVVVSGTSEYLCSSDVCVACDAQERFECGAINGNEENTWTDRAGAGTWNEDYTTTVLQGTESLFATDGETRSIPLSGADVYVTTMIQVFGSVDQYPIYSIDAGADNPWVIHANWDDIDAYHLRLGYDNWGGLTSSGSTPFIDGETIYVKMRYITGTGADAKYYLYISSNGTDWTLECSYESGTWTADATELRLQGASAAGVIFDDVRVDSSDISY